MATCHLCGAEPPDEEMVEHLRLMHPSRWWGDRPDRWIDGRAVVVDTTLEPDEFKEPVTENARVSRLMFEAMCSLSLLLVVTEQGSERDNYTRRIIQEIAAYRDEKGWSPYGFGGES